MKRESKTKSMPAGIDTLAGMKSILRIKPRLRFRVRVIVESYLLALSAGPRGEKNRGAARARRSAAARFAVAAVAAVAVFAMAFSGLSVLARSCNPGDALYFVKRAGERIDLAFTIDRYNRAAKNLDMAERRLEELNRLVAEGGIRSEEIAYLTNEYETFKTAATGDLDVYETVEKGRKLDLRLQELEERKLGLAEKIEEVAGASGILEPASSARVAVRDTSGEGLLDGNHTGISGNTGVEGEFEFTVNLEDGSGAEAITVLVEADGRAQVEPLGYPEGRATTGDGVFELDIDPREAIALEGSTNRFEFSLTSRDKPVAGRRIRIRDASGGLVEGKRGWAVIRTDDDGLCELTYAPKSCDDVGRFEIEVLDGNWKRLENVPPVAVLEIDSGDVRDTRTAAERMGFRLEIVPDPDTLDSGSHRLFLTVRKQYEKITDYIR